jgi:hypothetical protein
VWQEVVGLRQDRGDLLGAARLLLGRRDHAAATTALLDFAAARSHHLLRSGAATLPLSQAVPEFPDFPPAVARAAETAAVPAPAFKLLATSALALRSASQVAALKLDLVRPAAEEAGEAAVASLRLIEAHVSIMRDVLSGGGAGGSSTHENDGSQLKAAASDAVAPAAHPTTAPHILPTFEEVGAMRALHGPCFVCCMTCSRREGFDWCHCGTCFLDDHTQYLFCACSCCCVTCRWAVMLGC